MTAVEELLAEASRQADLCNAKVVHTRMQKLGKLDKAINTAITDANFEGLQNLVK